MTKLLIFGEKTALLCGRLLKGLVSRFAPRSALLAPSSASAAAFSKPGFTAHFAQRRSREPRGAPLRPRRGGAAWGGGFAAACRIRLRRMRRAAQVRRLRCSCERRRFGKCGREEQVESRERGGNCRKCPQLFVLAQQNIFTASCFFVNYSEKWLKK